MIKRMRTESTKKVGTMSVEDTKRKVKEQNIDEKVPAGLFAAESGGGTGCRDAEICNKPVPPHPGHCVQRPRGQEKAWHAFCFQ